MPWEKDANGNDVWVDTATGGTKPPGTIAVGSTQVFDNMVYQWDGTKWYNTGVHDYSRSGTPPPTFAEQLQLATAPRQSFSSSTSQSFQDPAYIQYLRETGQADRANALALEAQRAAAQAANTAATEAGANQRNQANIGSAAALQASQQGFTGLQNDLARAESAAQFAAKFGQDQNQFGATYGLQSANAENAYNQYVQGFQRQQQQDKLAAADQYAKLISNTDPAALPAFYQAGGGNILNAIHAGATGLSTNAVLPAAQTLRTIQSPWATPAPYVAPPAYTPAQYQAPDLSSIYARYQQQQEAQRTPQVPQQAPQAPAAPVSNEWAAANPGGTVTTTGGQVISGDIPNHWLAVANAAPREAYGTQGFQRFAHGTFITGDSTDPADPFAGGAHPEMVSVEDPPGPHNARASITPMSPPGVGSGQGFAALAGQLLSTVGSFLSGEGSGQQDSMPMGNIPRYAFGTDPNNPVVAEGDQPYIDQVTNLRQSIDTTPPIEGGYMNTGFSSLAPSLQTRYYSSLQDKYGTPTQDTQAEQAKYALKGIRRQPVYGLVATPQY